MFSTGSLPFWACLRSNLFGSPLQTGNAGPVAVTAWLASSETTGQLLGVCVIPLGVALCERPAV